MNLEYLVVTYGYLAVFLGTFLEGEAVLIIGGFLARGGYLKLIWVIFAAFIATLLWDQLFFYLGRRYKDKILKIKPHWKPRIKKILISIKKNSRKFIFSYRFIYGTRTLGPFAVGMSGVPTFKYIRLNILATFLWTLVFGFLGYFFGYTLELFLGRIKHYEFTIVLILVICFAIAWSIYRHFMRKSGKIGEVR